MPTPKTPLDPALKAALEALMAEWWGDREPGEHEEWSVRRVNELMKQLALAAGLPIPPWA
jgi:hypothetical protein